MENAIPVQGDGAVIFGSSAPSTRHHRAKARLICHPANAAPFVVSGKTARVLRLLATRRGGITPLDCVPWSLRLASIVHQLRLRRGLEILTEFEPHEGGFHARYICAEPLKVRWL